MQHNQSNIDLAASFFTNETAYKNTSIKLKNMKLKAINTDDIKRGISVATSEIKLANFSNNLIDEIPPSMFSTFTQLTRLYLENNYIFHVPVEIGNLANLQTLSLNNNLISFLPSSISKLQQLTTLLLHNNKLVSLPIELCKLKELKRISLHNNRFQKLPSIFHFFQNLREISLQWFAYLNPALKRLVKNENNGVEIIRKLKTFCKANFEKSIPLFTFEDFSLFFNDPKHSNTQLPLVTLACSYNDTALAGLLLDQGADPNQRDASGFTGLAIALRDENTKLAKILLEKKSNPNLDLQVCGTHLNIATIKMNPELVNLLLKHGSNPNLADNDGNTSLHLALSIFSKNVESFSLISQYLLEAGADPNSKNKDLWSPIHLAARRGEKDAIEWIVNFNKLKSRKGIDKSKLFNLNLKGGEKGWTPLHLASNSGHFEIVKILIESGSKIFKRNSEGLLSKQIFTGNLITYKYLIKCERDWVKSNMKANEVEKRKIAQQDSRALNEFLGKNKKNLVFQAIKDDDAERDDINNLSNISEKDANNTVSYNSVDMIPLSDFDSPLNTSRSQKIQALYYLPKENENPKSEESSKKKSFEKKKSPPNTILNENLTLQTISTDEELATTELFIKGPKMGKTQLTKESKEFKIRLLDYFKNRVEGTNIIMKFENKAFLVKRKKILSHESPLIEKIQSINYMKNLKDPELGLLLIFSTLEELATKKQIGNLETNMILLAILKLISFYFKTGFDTLHEKFLKTNLKGKSRIIENEIKNLMKLNRKFSKKSV